MEMSKGGSMKQKTIRGLFWSFSDLIANQGIQFIVQIILARLLLPEHFGIIGMIFIFIAISNSLVDSGVSQALIREQNPSQADYSTVFYFNFFMSLGLYGVLYFIAPFISSFFHEPQLVSIIRIISLGLIIYSIGIIQRTQIIKNINFKLQTKINIIAGISSGVIAIIFAFLGLGVWSLVIKMLSMQLIQSILYWFFNGWRPSFVFKFASFKRLFGFGAKITAAGLLSTIYSNIYYILIGRMFSATQLGYYTNASKLNEVASSSITTALQSVTYPVFSSIQNDEEKLKYGFKKIIRMSCFINFPALLGLAAIADPLVNIMFGEKWIHMVIYFQILCFAGMLYPVHAINLNILQVKGKSNLFLIISIIKRLNLTILIALAIWLKMGVIGLVGTTVIHSYISFWLNSYYSGKEISYSCLEQIKDISLFYVISIIMAFIVYTSGMFLPDNNFIKMFIQIFLGLVFYVGIGRLAKISELNEIRGIVLLLFNRFRLRKIAQ